MSHDSQFQDELPLFALAAKFVCCGCLIDTGGEVFVSFASCENPAAIKEQVEVKWAFFQEILQLCQEKYGRYEEVNKVTERFDCAVIIEKFSSTRNPFFVNPLVRPRGSAIMRTISITHKLRQVSLPPEIPSKCVREFQKEKLSVTRYFLTCTSSGGNVYVVSFLQISQ